MQWVKSTRLPTMLEDNLPLRPIQAEVSSTMVNFCAVVGCSNRSSRESSKKFFRLSVIVSHQGKEARVLSEKLREKRPALWLLRIHQADLKESQYPNIRIRSDHFVKGQPASLYEKDDLDWAPLLRLGHARVKAGTAAQD